MKKIDILNGRLDQLYTEDQISELRVNLLRNRMQKEQKLILEKYFGTSYNGYKLTIGKERVSVTIDGSNWGVVDFYLYAKWGSDVGEKFDRIEMSTGSFRPEKMDESVVKRFEMLSHFSKLVVDFEDDILAEFNTNSKKYNKLINTFSDSRRDLRTSIRNQEDDIKLLEKEALIEKLFDVDGITINSVKGDNYLPNLQIKYNYRVNGICKLKGLRKSASGKSIDLEITTRFKTDYKSDKFTYRTQNVDMVRFDNVESFLRTHKRQIV
jgi:hypothetical protein